MSEKTQASLVATWSHRFNYSDDAVRYRLVEVRPAYKKHSMYVIEQCEFGLLGEEKWRQICEWMSDNSGDSSKALNALVSLVRSQRDIITNLRENSP